MPRYLLKVTDEGAARLESWLGGMIRLVPADPADIMADLRDPENGGVPDRHHAEAKRRLAAREPVVVAGLDAITDEEYETIAPRLRTSGPLYHAGGPG